MNTFFNTLRRQSLVLILIAFAAASSVSCKDEDDAKPDLGKMTIEGQQYKVKAAAIFESEPVDVWVEEEIETWYEHEINFSDLDEVDLFITVLDKNVELESGTYTFSEEQELMTVQSAYLSGENFSFEDLTSATVVVVRDGDKYKFEITALITDIPVTVTFSGKPQIVITNDDDD